MITASQDPMPIPPLGTAPKRESNRVWMEPVHVNLTFPNAIPPNSLAHFLCNSSDAASTTTPALVPRHVPQERTVRSAGREWRCHSDVSVRPSRNTESISPLLLLRLSERDAPGRQPRRYSCLLLAAPVRHCIWQRPRGLI
jgi:hypothetical protein